MSQQTIPGTAPNAPAGRTETDALAENLRRAMEPSVIELRRGTADAAGALLVPQGMQVHHLRPFLDPYLPKPVRRAGTTVLHDLVSFVAAVKRAKGESTVVYLDANQDDEVSRG